MKRIRIIGVALLALWLCVLCVWPVSAEQSADAICTYTWNGSVLNSEDTTAAFWENPQLQAGQSRRGGSLILINRSVGSVEVTLGSVQLPYDDEAALTYLNALHLTIRDGDRMLYDGAFSRIGDSGLTGAITLQGGETRVLSIDLSCDFAYEGAVTCGVLRWDWRATATSWLNGLQPVLDTWMFWAPALLLIIGLIVWMRVRRRHTDPTGEEKAEPADKPDDQPETAPQPPRYRATHAAPRHMKKK